MVKGSAARCYLFNQHPQFSLLQCIDFADIRFYGTNARQHYDNTVCSIQQIVYILRLYPHFEENDINMKVFDDVFRGVSKIEVLHCNVPPKSPGHIHVSGKLLDFKGFLV